MTKDSLFKCSCRCNVDSLRNLILMTIEITISFNIYLSLMLIRWYCFCPKFFLQNSRKVPESFLSEVVSPKLVRPKVFDCNVIASHLFSLCVQVTTGPDKQTLFKSFDR